MKKIISFITAILVVFTSFSCIPVYAAGRQTEISSAKDLISLAEKCRLDSYSLNLTVTLKNDIDLKNSEFEYIPYFSGTFDGKGYAIKNFSLEKSGSQMGFIRCTSVSAKIKNLNINGKVISSGSSRETGGIVGNNQGTIEKCSFSGKVSGKENTGGIAGKNTGMITDCENSAEISGEHRTGGISGSNTGLIYKCTNKGNINNTVLSTEQPVIKSGLSLKNFDIAEVSEDNFLDITDIGGITGFSEGSISECENSGIVGYDRTGYNTGGIVGRNTGTVTSCTNNGDIIGKKDIGGIVGQAEPYSQWDFSQSKLESLKNSVNDIKSKIETLKKDVSNSSDDIKKQISEIEKSVSAVSDDTKNAAGQLSADVDETKKTADKLISEIKDAVSKHDHKLTKELLEQLKQMNDNHVIDLNEMIYILRLVRSEEKRHFEKEHLESEYDLSGTVEEIIAGMELQKPDIESIYKDIQNIGENTAVLENLMQSGSDNIKKDAKALKESLLGFADAMQITAKDVSQVKISTMTDVSADGKYNNSIIQNCNNQGDVYAEINAGGIAGTVSFEIAFDAEDKLQVSDYLLNDAKYLIFSVIKNCESKNEVTAKKQNAGGILGNADFGLTDGCTSSGTIRVISGEYCGGIAGLTNGDIKNSSSKSILYGNGYVGGIVGHGRNIFDCKAYSFIESGAEFTGSIAGSLDGQAEKCCFIENGMGGIDGISYKDKAEPLTYQDMMKRNDIPDIFRKITVTFIAENTTVAEIDVNFGGKIDQLPEVPKNGLQYWKWNDFDNEHIYYSQTVEGKYKNPKTTISTNEEIPLFLAEGNFYEGQTLTAEPVEKITVKDGEPLAAYKVYVNDFSGKLKIRMKASDGGQLYLSGKSADYEKDGSYIVFKAENGSEIIYTKSENNFLWVWIAVISLFSAAAITVIIFVIVKYRHKKTVQAKQPSDQI